MLRILAALIFFTRLPFWRLAEVPAVYFKNIVSLWPLAGWLTAGLMALVYYAASLCFPSQVALLLAIFTRLLITGCLHEDGLADFFDGFGGGTNRERVLAIMKDSHIGSYGVIGLISYFLLLYTTLSALPAAWIGCVILAGDPFCKSVSAWIINFLPYARKAEEAKNKTVYSRMTMGEKVGCVVIGWLPLYWLPSPLYGWAILFPLVVSGCLFRFMWRKIQGYTGDCCGATFLLTELTFYLGVLLFYHLS